MPFTEIRRDINNDNQRVFTAIENLGSPETSLNEKIEDDPTLLGYYKFFEFTDEQIREIEILKSTYQPLSSIFLTNQPKPRQEEDTEELYFEGRGVYHKDGDRTIYVKGQGYPLRALRSTSSSKHGYPGIPDHRVVLGAQQDQLEGTMDLEEAQIGAAYSISLLKRLMDRYHVTSIKDAIAKGWAVPIGISIYPEMSKEIYKVLHNGKSPKSSFPLYASMVSIVPGEQRLSQFITGSNKYAESDYYSSEEMLRKWKGKRRKVLYSVGKQIRDMLEVKILQNHQSFHTQNVSINLDTPEIAFLVDSNSYLDLSTVDEYHTVHYLAYSLKRDRGGIHGISPDRLDSYTDPDMRKAAIAYYEGLLEGLCPKEVIKLIPALRVLFSPTIDFAMAEVLIRKAIPSDFNPTPVINALSPKLRKKEAINLQSYKNNEGAVFSVNLPLDSEISPWLKESYAYVEAFITWLETGDDSKIRGNSDISLLFSILTRLELTKEEIQELKKGTEFLSIQEGRQIKSYFDIIHNNVKKIQSSNSLINP